MAKSMGYRPNLAASVSLLQAQLRISVNLPEEIASFFNHVRAGIESEHVVLSKASVDLEFRSFPRLGVGEVDAFDDAVETCVNGIITAVGHPDHFVSRVRKALRRNIPVVWPWSPMPRAPIASPPSPSIRTPVAVWSAT